MKNEIMLSPCEGVPSGDVFSVTQSKHPVGATAEYMSGLYILQSASSALAVSVLNPQKNEVIVDMCAAPGGKTTYIASLMENTGVVYAIEKKKERACSLSVTLQRMNCRNTIVVNSDALDWPCNENSVHRVLLDAPCSGVGIIAKDHSIKSNRTKKDFDKAKNLQIRLLNKALHIVKRNGIVVYSTCSLTFEENESVISAVKKTHNFVIEPLDDIIGEPGLTNFKGKKFTDDCINGRRIYPHQTDMSGLVIFKLRKL